MQNNSVAVLASGGLDSAILVGDLARQGMRVFPVYVRFGLIWEEVEQAGLARFLETLGDPRVAPLQVFEMPIRPVYGEHWSTTGADVPGFETPDEAVFLPGRNLLLAVQAAIWCCLNKIPRLAMAPLAANPFPDSTDSFFEALQRAVNLAVDGRLEIVRPYQHLHKRDVLARGVGMPLEHTFSCIHPVGGIHCGACNKCAERQAGFHEAGIPDRTHYAR